MRAEARYVTRAGIPGQQKTATPLFGISPGQFGVYSCFYDLDNENPPGACHLAFAPNFYTECTPLQRLIMLASVPVLLLAGVCASMWPTYSLVGFALLLVLVICLFFHRQVVIFLIFLAPFDPSFLGIEFTYEWSVPYKSSIPLFTVLLVFALLGLGLSKLRRGSRILTQDGLKPVLAMLLFWSGLGVLWAPIYEYGMLHFCIMASNIMLYLFITESIDSEKILREAFWGAMVFGVLLGIYSIVMRYYDSQVFEYKLWERGFLQFRIMGLDWNDRTRTVNIENLSAFVANLFMSINIGLLIWEKDRLRRIILIASLCIMLFGFFLTMSRGGSLAYILMVMFIIFVFKRLRKYFISLGLASGGLFILTYIASLLYLASQKPPRFLAKDVDTYNHAILTRMNYWKVGFDKIFSDELWNGFGTGGFKYHCFNCYSHSIPFGFLFDYGLMGCVLFILIVTIVAARVMSMLPHQKTFSQTMFMCLSGGMLATAFHGLFDLHPALSVLYMYLGLFTVTYFFARRDMLMERTAGRTP